MSSAPFFSAPEDDHPREAVAEDGQPLPSRLPAPSPARARGVLQRADPGQRADSTVPWSTHAVGPRLRYLLACPVATPCGLRNEDDLAIGKSFAQSLERARAMASGEPVTRTGAGPSR